MCYVAFFCLQIMYIFYYLLNYSKISQIHKGGFLGAVIKLSEDFIIEQSIKASGGTDWCCVSFSAGKDSIAVFLRLWEKNVFDKFLLVHQYFVPGISFIEDYMDYFCNRFKNCHLVQSFSPNVTKMITSGTFQDYQTFNANQELIEKDIGFYNYGYGQLTDWATEGMTGKKRYSAVGVKYSDSVFRLRMARKMVDQNTIIREDNKAFYPILDYTKNEVWEIIKKHNVKMSKEYEMYGKSLDGLDPVFLIPIKNKFPKDYARIKEYFPQIDLVEERLKRYGV